MRVVTKRELNQHTAQVLACVDAGETIVVTERGVQRWQIQRMSPRNTIEHLTRSGQLRPAMADPRPWPEQSPAAYTPAEVDALLADSRGDH